MRLRTLVPLEFQGLEMPCLQGLEVPVLFQGLEVPCLQGLECLVARACGALFART